MATLIYLGHRVEIGLSDPYEDNTICIAIYQEESYDPTSYNQDLLHYQISAESDDPNQWVIEGVRSAIAKLALRGVELYEQAEVKASNGEGDSDLPF